MKQSWHIPVSILILLSVSHQVAAQQSEEDDLIAAYGDNKTVSIATGTQQLIVKAPASATVITARQMEAAGYYYLAEALESVPGFHVSRSSIANDKRFYIRGLASPFNPEVLILVNGRKTNTSYDNSSGAVSGETPLTNVSRIEVIRGPGSALYGADAFSGVVNIITKSAEEIKGVEAGVRLGSFNTKNAWVQYGGNIGALQAALYLGYGKGDGFKGFIERDAQTLLDEITGTHASRAPGVLSNDARELDAKLDLTYGNWRMRAGYADRLLGISAGLNAALDPAAKLPGQRYNFDFTYKRDNLFPSFDVEVGYDYYQLVEKVGSPAFELLPPGASLGVVFPNGLIGNPGHSERHNRFHALGLYSGFAGHRIRVGIGREFENLYSAEEFKNFTISNGQIVPLGSTVNATGNPDLVYILPAKRALSYAFIQDEWTVAKDWSLTAGIRHDKYSDFGSTTNPRLALVWDAAFNFTLKALHGRAFRAPAFTEQFNRNNPVAGGNPNVKPERIRTTELIAVWQARTNLQINATIFSFQQSNIINYVVTPGSNGTAIASNTGDQNGRGVELEATWDFNRNFRLSGNYSYQHSIDKATDKDTGLAPSHRLFLRSDWRFASFWQLGTTLNYVADRKRQQGDGRPPIVDYTTVDLNLRCEKLAEKWELQATVKNLFNRDVREPTLSPGVNLPNDLPQPKRAIYLQIATKF